MERHGFQEKARVPREKSGRHSNLIYLVLKPLKQNPGRHSVTFQYFEDVFIIFQWFSIILKMLFIDFSLFWSFLSIMFPWISWFKDVFGYCPLIFHYCSLIFHDFQDVVHYFSMIFHYFQGVLHFFVHFSTLLITFVSLIFWCFRICFIIFHYLLGSFFCNLHAYSTYLQYHIHGRHGTVENSLRILEF